MTSDPTEPVMHETDDEAADQDIEGRFPEAVRNDDGTAETPQEHPMEADPAVPPPQTG